LERVNLSVAGIDGKMEVRISVKRLEDEESTFTIPASVFANPN